MRREINGRDTYECANQLGGYVGPDTPDNLAKFLLRESNAAAELADEIERQSRLIDELVEALERIAFNGRADKHNVMSQALDYVNSGGKHPNERTIAAVALSKAQSHKPNEGQRDE